MGLNVSIYRSGDYDCTNRGISAKPKGLCLVNVDGPFNPTPDYPAARLVRRGRVGNVVVIPEGKDDSGVMFGGNFAYCSDARFGDAVQLLSGYEFGFPIAIHDRVE